MKAKFIYYFSNQLFFLIILICIKESFQQNNSTSYDTSDNKGISTFVNRYVGAYAIIRKVSTAIRNAFSNIKELDKTITSIAVVTNMSQEDLWNKVGQYTQMAQEYGVTTNDVYKVSQLFYQQGLDTAEALEGKANTDMDNLTDTGKQNVKGIAQEAVVVAAGDNVAVASAYDADGNKIYTVSALGIGQIADGNTGLVTGDTVYNETRPAVDGDYISKDKSAGENLSALDKALKETKTKR